MTATKEPRRTLVMAVPCPLGRADLPRLFARTCALLASAAGGELLLCDVAGVEADAVAVEALARLALAARRAGCEVRLRGASPELLGLLALVGLADVLPGGDCGGEPATQPGGTLGPQPGLEAAIDSGAAAACRRSPPRG